MADSDTTDTEHGALWRAATSPLGKGFVFLACIGVLASFGEGGIHLLLELMHLLLEWLELFLEHILELVLHLPLHTTQMLTAWIGLLFLSLIGVWGLARGFAALQAWGQAAAQQFAELSSNIREWCEGNWVFLVAFLLILGFVLSFLI